MISVGNGGKIWADSLSHTLFRLLSVVTAAVADFRSLFSFCRTRSVSLFTIALSSEKIVEF